MKLPSKAETFLSSHKVNLEQFQVSCATADVGGMQVHLHRYTAASAMIFISRIKINFAFTIHNNMT